MTDDELLDRIGHELEQVEASAPLRRRVVVTAREAAGRAHRRNRRRGRVMVAAVAGALMIAASAAALTIRPWDGGGLPAQPGARAGIAGSAVLSQAPWLVQRAAAPYLQDVPALPALRFPAGTSYAKAVQALVRSVLADGTLPPGSSTGPPLPSGIVWDPHGHRLSLVVPFSYTPSGRIRVPTFRIPRSLRPNEASSIVSAARGGAAVGSALAGTIRLEVPSLRSCQLLGGQDAPCGLPGRSVGS